MSLIVLNPSEIIQFSINSLTRHRQNNFNINNKMVIKDLGSNTEDIGNISIKHKINTTALRTISIPQVRCP